MLEDWKAETTSNLGDSIVAVLGFIESSWTVEDDSGKMQYVVLSVKNWCSTITVGFMMVTERIGNYFFRMTQYNTDAHNTHAYSPLWIHVRKPYPYEHLRRTEHRQFWRFPYANPTPMSTSEGLSTGSSGDSRSHQWHLVVDGNVAYHLTHNAGKSWKIQEKVRAPGFELWWVASHRTVLPLDYKLNRKELGIIALGKSWRAVVVQEK
jgi:hypothetical protein